MTKRELIEDIVTLNHTAEPGFLARFEEEDLRVYLDHLRAVREPRLQGDAARYARYFATPAATPAEHGLSSPGAEVDAAERAALLSPQPPPEETAEQTPRTPQPPFSREPQASAKSKDDTRTPATVPPPAENPTTRRDSAAARAAKPWRKAPLVPVAAADPAPKTAEPDDAPPEDPSADEPPADDDLPADEEDSLADAFEAQEPPPDGAEDSGAEFADDPDAEDAPAASEETEEEPAQALAAAPTIAGREDDENSQSWLF